MTIFLTADTHFGHARIIELADRPFQSVGEMNAAMIERWNRVVGPKDEVFHLGDFCHHSEDAGLIFSRLNGRKSLIVGNHDDDQVVNLPWAARHHLHELRYDKRKIVLCHYPLVEWNGFYRGAVHAHGHQHNKNPIHGASRPRIDVGVDAWNFTPIAIDEAIMWSDQNDTTIFNNKK